ncbi:MAG: BrnT family toxin [Symploca sp. SIO2E6]|nr:BrnT family toxin [Symploca sp. SIO2E6]
MIFEWDKAKAAANLEKHGISFEIAIQVFADNKRIVRIDDRFLLAKISRKLLITSPLSSCPLCLCG